MTECRILFSNIENETNTTVFVVFMSMETTGKESINLPKLDSSSVANKSLVSHKPDKSLDANNCLVVDHKVDLTSPSCNVVFTQSYICFSQVEQMTRIRL